MNKILLFSILTINICCLHAEGGNYNGKSPSYHIRELENGEKIVKKTRFFWVRNYRNNEKKLDALVLKLMCESLVDSLNITEVELELATGGSKFDIELLESYKWNVSKPDTIERGLRHYLPFGCEHIQ
ncbi:MAG: hypothetical protein AAF806_12980 [Bacteroidota bacterium]